MSTDERTEESRDSSGASPSTVSNGRRGGRSGMVRRSWRWVRGLPGRVPRGARRGILVVLALLAVCAVLGGISALSARRHLLEARADLREGRTGLVRGEAEEAREAFERAGEAALRASDDAGSPWLRVLGVLPYVGRTPDALSAVAQAAERTARAGVELATALVGLPDGLGSLAPDGGRLPIERIGSLAAPLARADALSGQALELVRSAPATLIPGALAEARREALAELDQAHASLQAASRIVDGLPAFLGEQRPRRYFFAAENPAEMRGTGGLLGAYSILTVTRGRFAFSPFAPIQDLPSLPLDEAPFPSEEFASSYRRFLKRNSFWRNINITPDFPAAARAILLNYEATLGERLDGVIAAEPSALEGLLRVTGPVRDPKLGVEVDAHGVVAFTANEAYAQFPNRSERKLILGEIAKRVVTTFLHDTDPSVRSLRALAQTLSRGSINVYSADPELERGLAATVVGGALPPPEGDVLAVIQNNAGGNKIDYYEQRTVTYAVDLLEDGSARAAVDVEIRNDAPSHGKGTRYVIGPLPGLDTVAGENRSIQAIYCRLGCGLERLEVSGGEEPLHTGSESGYRFFQTQIDVLSQETGSVRAMLSLPGAWTGNSSGGAYRFQFVNQTAINPTRLRVEIRPPDGMDWSSASEGLREEADGRLVYEGTPGPGLVLEARFSPSLLDRWWRNVTRALSTPVVHL